VSAVVLMQALGVEEIDMCDGCMGNLDVDVLGRLEGRGWDGRWL
jgi:hypothetical protein